FFVWPLLRVVLRSFVEPKLGFGNYYRVLFTGPFVKVFLNTFEIALSVTLICLLIAYPLAYVIAGARGLRLKLLSGLVVIPLWTSVVIRSYAWMILFQRRGVLNEAMTALGWIDQPLQI